MLSDKISGPRSEPTRGQDYHATADTQAPPVDTLKRGRGRPASGVDRKEQKRLAEAKRRQRLKGEAK